MNLIKSEKGFYLFFPAVLLIAGILRFYNYSEMSLTGDELGALNRLRYETLKEIIDKGIRPDAHPGGVQIFLYCWTAIFGESEAALRLPFVLAGILSVWMLYLIGTAWFGKECGLLSSLSLAVLQFPVLYSQLARPYSFGLLFTLLSVWYLSKIAFCPSGNKTLNIAGYILFTALCMYTHYFSFLTALAGGVCGLITGTKKTRMLLLIAGIGCAVVFLPQLSITLRVMYSEQGLERLGKPGWMWLPEHLFFALNGSFWVVTVTAVAVVAPLFLRRKDNVFPSGFLRIVSVSLFFIPFLAGFIYSLAVKPVLQNSVLLFSFPFFLVFIFSFSHRLKNLFLFMVFFLLTGATGIISTVCEKQYYQINHFAEIKKIVTTTYQWMDGVGSDNVTCMAVLYTPGYLDYYYKKYNRTVDFYVKGYMKREEIADMIAVVEDSKKDYLLFAWTNQWFPLEIFPVIRMHFPFLEKKEWFFDSEIYLFSKNPPEANKIPTPVFYSVNGFENNTAGWEMKENMITDTLFYSGKKSEMVSNTSPFSSTFSMPLCSVLQSVDDIVCAGVTVYPAHGADAILCISFSKDDSVYSWHDTPFSLWPADSSDRWKSVFLCTRIPQVISPQDKIRVFVWNRSEKNICIDDLRMWVEKGNPVIYGKRKDHVILGK